MRIVGIAVACLALLVGGALLLYHLVFPTFTYRYRMTVEVEIDGITRSASSVIQVVAKKQPSFPGPLPPFNYTVTGEAVYVDLGDKLNLIAILAGGPGPKLNVDYPSYLVPALFGMPVGTTAEARKLEGLRGARSVPVSLWPMFISYSNSDDPKSARMVDPLSVIDGHKVEVKAVIVETTRDPISWSIEGRLPWLTHTEGYLAVPGNPFTDTLQFGRSVLSRR